MRAETVETDAAATRLPWRPHSEMYSATISEIARAGGIEVMVYDLPPNPHFPERIVGWEIHDGPSYDRQVAKASGFDTYAAAKEDATRVALEQIRRRARR